MLEFARSLTPRSAAARKLARHLNDQQIESLEQGREFAISHEDRDLLFAALPDHVTPEELPSSGEIRLTRNQSFLLRWEIISRLNSCEAVAQCWLTDVAHKKTIEDELRFLLDAESGRNILTTFRSIASAPNYPALSALIAELERQRMVHAVPGPMDRPIWKLFVSKLSRVN